METFLYSTLDDKRLVELLLQDDAGAWDYVLTEIISPLCRARKYIEICKKNSISSDSLITQVWMLLRKNDYSRLRTFAFRSSLKTYLFIIVREAQRIEFREQIGKIPFVLSENDDFCSLIASRKGSDSIELKEEMSLANEALGQLWRENAKQAWVLLLRNSLNLSTREVASFLGESIANVDQMNKRAKSKLKKIRREIQ